jgi:UDP-3-O-[3-hydroxymyristoyl] glucosamine N-acyltransferase
VVLYAGVRLGSNVEVHAGTVLGADGFGYATAKGVHHKIPQVGTVAIGDDVEIGALSAVDRALLGTTSIGAGTKIDNLVQVGHNVRIGRSSILCGQAGIAGSTTLGDGVVLAGQVGVSNRITIGDGVRVAAKSAVFDDVAKGMQVAGTPAIEASRWRRQVALLRRLPELRKRLTAIERGAAARDALDRSPTPESEPDGE